MPAKSLQIQYGHLNGCCRRRRRTSPCAHMRDEARLLRPLTTSSSTTPKLKMSHFSVTSPSLAHSGGAYPLRTTRPCQSSVLKFFRCVLTVKPLRSASLSDRRGTASPCRSLLYLRLPSAVQKHIGWLQISVDHDLASPLMKVAYASSDPMDDLQPRRPTQ